jgi:hypothetical protein
MKKILLVLSIILLNCVSLAQGSDSLKARAIFDRVTDNIEYDIEAYRWIDCLALKNNNIAVLFKNDVALYEINIPKLKIRFLAYKNNL